LNYLERIDTFEEEYVADVVLDLTNAGSVEQNRILQIPFKEKEILTRFETI
jgi:hypothetical protein